MTRRQLQELTQATNAANLSEYLDVNDALESVNMPASMRDVIDLTHHLKSLGWVAQPEMKENN